MRITGSDSRAETDRRLDEMIRHLKSMYTEAADELDKKSKAYFEQFKREDEQMRKKLDAGKITEKQYKAWRRAEMVAGKRYQRMQKQFTERLANVNADALAYLNGEMPEIYATNYNDMGGLTVDAVNESLGTGISFDLVDEDTVRLLAADDPELLPRKSLDIPKDQRWNRQKMQSELLQGILLGEDIPTIAARMRNVTDMNESAAIRNARTMVTSAENHGRLNAMQRTSDMGIVQKKHWMSSDQPGRTRDWHMPGAFDRLTVDINEPFENELGKIMYPGDAAAAPANVYNCRCSMCSEVVGFVDPETGKFLGL